MKLVIILIIDTEGSSELGWENKLDGGHCDPLPIESEVFEQPLVMLFASY